MRKRRTSGGVERRGRVRQQAKEMFRHAILDAAEEAFATAGFYGARMQDIARRAGLAVGTIYNHFAQKEDVLAALLEQRVAEVLDALAPRAGDPADFAGRLAARIERVLAFRERHAAFFALAADLGLLGDETSGARKVLEHRALTQTGRLSAVWLALVDEGLAMGALPPQDHELAAALLKSTLRTVARWARDHRPMPPPELARLVCEIFLRSCGATESRTRRPPTRTARLTPSGRPGGSPSPKRARGGAG